MHLRCIFRMVEYKAQYRKSKKRLHKGELSSVKENLRLFKGPPERLLKRSPEGLPERPPERLEPVKENPEFEKFEISSDNESNGKIYKKNEKKYLDDKATFCSANLKRNRGETTRSQAKKKIIEEYPNIDLRDLDLMLQISPRIYRLLQVFNSNWILLDALLKMVNFLK
ncbi:hypothetical protein C1646_774695 [Rhizophagus diaphanus]|nr:hypothetical protein C1646_774695 [Rhizophagus diaphanus] [Rhizophagus sp. MUCL 43196]